MFVFPGSDLNGALNQAERLRSCIGKEPMDIFEGAFPVTISLGVAASKEVKEADLLVRAADAALYRAKNGGRNRVEPANDVEVTQGALSGGAAPGPSKAKPREDR